MTTTATICLDEHIPGAINFRDLGGYRAGDGRVRCGLIYRAGMTHHIDAAGLDALAERYGIRSVIDLRSGRELAEDGLAAFEGTSLTHVHLPVFDEINLAPEEAAERFARMREGGYDWTTSYLRMIDEGASAYRGFFAYLAGPDALPAVFHCMGGRDRTGVAAALRLRVLGVTPEDVAEDYALTGGYLRPHLPRFLRQAERMQMTEAEMADLLETTAAPMLAFLKALEERHGSVEGYLVSIGVPGETLEILRERLLEPAS